MFNPFIFSKGAWSNILKLRNAVTITKTIDTDYEFDYSELIESYLKNKGNIQIKDTSSKNEKSKSANEKIKNKTKNSLLNKLKNIVSRKKVIKTEEFNCDTENTYDSDTSNNILN